MASIIDSLVMMPFSIIGTFAAGLGSVHPVFAVIGANLPGILSVVYITFAHAYYGQTVGKKVMKIKVLDDSEKPLIFGQAVLRSLPQIATVFFV
ncbi:MAG TPA: RDD family protein, partial [Pyrinomonadaceae bacterium]|nr:RDD family protein [Pyrinomonadaceae bacterium]